MRNRTSAMDKQEKRLAAASGTGSDNNSENGSNDDSEGEDTKVSNCMIFEQTQIIDILGKKKAIKKT